MQVSEHASWSSQYYGRIISAALAAVGEASLPACLPACFCTVQVSCSLLCRWSALPNSCPVPPACSGVWSVSVPGLWIVSDKAWEGQRVCCAGAPPDLVQIVHGYAEAGNALVTGGVNKVIFVGSTGVGKAVMQVCKPTQGSRKLHIGNV